MFRSGILDNHPKSIYTAPSAEKLLGREYSTFLYENGEKTTNQSSYDQIPIGMNILHLIRTGDNDHIYSTHLDESEGWVKWSHVRFSYVLLSHKGVGDIMTVTGILLQSFLLKGKMPPIFENSNAGVLTVTGNMYIILASNQVVKIDQDSALIFRAFGIGEEAIYLSVEDRFIDNVQIGWSTDHVPEIYNNNTLIRYYQDKHVYLVDNLLRRPVNSIKVFYDHGWDFDQVKVVMDSDFINILPIGPPV